MISARLVSGKPKRTMEIAAAADMDGNGALPGSRDIDGKADSSKKDKANSQLSPVRA